MRKTGPGFKLDVLSCGVHGRAFTLYPPGHVPYGRQVVAPVAIDGAPIGPAEEEQTELPSATGQPLHPWFVGTCFEAAMDAAEGRAWAREIAGFCDRRWQTQRRALARQVIWLGVAPAISNAVREAVAAALDVPLLLLVEQARALAKSPGYRSRGVGVCTVLAAIHPETRLYDRLAGAAHAAGLLGLMLRLDVATRTLRPPPSFRQPGTRAPPRERDRSPTPRNGDFDGRAVAAYPSPR